jgi:hypothetical protein
MHAHDCRSDRFFKFVYDKFDIRIHVHIHTFIHTYIHTYTHMHTHYCRSDRFFKFVYDKFDIRIRASKVKTVFETDTPAQQDSLQTDRHQTDGHQTDRYQTDRHQTDRQTKAGKVQSHPSTPSAGPDPSSHIREEVRRDYADGVPLQNRGQRVPINTRDFRTSSLNGQTGAEDDRTESARNDGANYRMNDSDLFKSAAANRRFAGMGSSIAEADGDDGDMNGDDEEEDDGDGPMVVDFVDEGAPGAYIYIYIYIYIYVCVCVCVCMYITCIHTYMHRHSMMIDDDDDDDDDGPKVVDFVDEGAPGAYICIHAYIHRH